MIRETFEGRWRFLAITVWIKSILLVAVGLWSAVQFLDADTTREQILWATLFLVGMLGSGLCSLWYWGLVFALAGTSRRARRENGND